MLFLLFQIEQNRFAIDVCDVVEVLPLVEMTPLSNAPAGFAGLFNRQGRAVPAIDLRVVLRNEPSRRKMSTRIIVINCALSPGDLQPLGLIAEDVTRTIRIDRGNAAPRSLEREMPYLVLEAGGDRPFVHLVGPETLVPPPLLDALVQIGGRPR